MLQNRVDPFGNLIRTEARGHWMGNRGILHNDEQEIVREFKLKAWLTCRLEFNSRKRKVMSEGRYTELFFLDEATAFAAGHRPCFECRRKDFNSFKYFWLIGNPEHHFNEKTSVQKIDNVLHSERISQDKSKITHDEKIDNIPNGAFVLFKNKAYLFLNQRMLLWSPAGYDGEKSLPKQDTLDVLTPKSVVNAFRAGYAPQMKAMALIQ